MKKLMILSLIGAMAVLSACGSDDGEVTDTVFNEPLPEETVIVTEAPSEAYVQEESVQTVLTASSEEISRLIEENELPVMRHLSKLHCLKVQSYICILERSQPLKLTFLK